MKIYVDNNMREKILAWNINVISEHNKKNALQNKSKHSCANLMWEMLYVVSHIYIRPYIDKSYKTTDYINMNFHVLRNLIGSGHCKRVLDDLVIMGILETDNHYIQNWKSRGYRIIDRDKQKWKLIAILNAKLDKKLEAARDKKNSIVDGLGNGYDVVNRWLYKVRIDKKQALVEIGKIQDPIIKESYKCSVNMISEGEIFAVVDNTAGRFHNNITNLGTSMRKHLSICGIDNVELWGTDLVNSQPVFMSTVLCGNVNIDQKELKKFQEVVCNGEFYEYMATSANLQIDLQDLKKRKVFKQKIFSGVLFNQNRLKLSKWEKIFQNVFPTIFQEVQYIKKNEHNAFAILLQRAESKFFFHCISIIDNTIGSGIAPLLTIHDSILSTKEWITTIESIVLQEFQTIHNIQPLLKTKKE